MSTRTTPVAAAVDGYTHPDWCDLRKCDPHRPHDDLPAGGLHESAGTSWSVQADEVEISVAIARSDDMLGGRNHGRTFLHLHMLAHNNQTPGYADAWLSPEDVTRLIQFLQEYAQRVKDDLLYPPGTYDSPASEIPRHL